MFSICSPSDALVLYKSLAINSCHSHAWFNFRVNKTAAEAKAVEINTNDRGGNFSLTCNFMLASIYSWDQKKREEVRQTDHQQLSLASSSWSQAIKFHRLTICNRQTVRQQTWTLTTWKIKFLTQKRCLFDLTKLSWRRMWIMACRRHYRVKWQFVVWFIGHSRDS